MCLRTWGFLDDAYPILSYSSARPAQNEKTATFTGRAEAIFTSAAPMDEAANIGRKAQGYLLMRVARLGPRGRAVVLGMTQQSYDVNKVVEAMRTSFPDTPPVPWKNVHLA